jgi:hypothetical protein
VNPARLVSEPDTYKGLTETGCITERTQQRQRDRVSITVGVHAELNKKKNYAFNFFQVLRHRA